jgi:coenzyme F420-reducing hydrogenase delta subunit
LCCRHCAYAAADLAGAMRLRYPASVRIVEVPCTGRVEPLEMLHAFERGVDGVMVAG